MTMLLPYIYSKVLGALHRSSTLFVCSDQRSPTLNLFWGRNLLVTHLSEMAEKLCVIKFELVGCPMQITVMTPLKDKSSWCGVSWAAG